MHTRNLNRLMSFAFPYIYVMKLVLFFLVVISKNPRRERR